MRTFIGIKLDSQIIDRIVDILKPVKKIATPIRWVKEDNIHLTLKFLGEITQEKYGQVENRVNSIGKNINPLNLQVRGLGKFGRNETLDILWVGIEKNKFLEELVQSIENLMDEIGFPREKRPFSPHVTLGRNKKNFNIKPIVSFLEEKGDIFISDWLVTGMQLIKSDLASSGPIYTVLKEIPFVST